MAMPTFLMPWLPSLVRRRIAILQISCLRKESRVQIPLTASNTLKIYLHQQHNKNNVGDIIDYYNYGLFINGRYSISLSFQTCCKNSCSTRRSDIFCRACDRICRYNTYFELHIRVYFWAGCRCCFVVMGNNHNTIRNSSSFHHRFHSWNKKDLIF